MSETLASAAEAVSGLTGGRAAEWDLRGELPRDVLRELGSGGLLCAQASAESGGLGFSSAENGELTAHVGTVCGSLRSVMTAQGICAWTLQRFGSSQQQAEFLVRLTSGEIAGVALSEADAGSDLSGIRTEVGGSGGSVVVDGAKVWVTGADYADWLVVFGRYGDGAGIVVVPTDAPGVRIDRVPDPLGCRAAGFADVRLDRVRLPRRHLLGGAGMPVSMLATSPLTYGRISVAWGCVGILRACLSEAAGHAKRRKTFGAPLADHQLILRHLAELYVGERAATYACEQVSRQWDEKSPDQAATAFLAKHLAAGYAARGASAAVQVLASAGARDGQVVARAYRDAKLMEIIEGSNEISQLMMAQQALGVWG